MIKVTEKKHSGDIRHDQGDREETNIVEISDMIKVTERNIVEISDMIKVTEKKHSGDIRHDQGDREET